MEENKYLKLARQAKKDGNSEDAKNYYNKVREENPDDGEAKFYYAYYALYEGTNGELGRRFVNLCNVIPSAIDLIKQTDLEKADQLKLIEDIVETFVPETWAENRYMNRKNHETKVGDSYVKVFEVSVVRTCGQTGMAALKALGDQLENLYVADPECKRLAVIAWKEYVSLSQKWYAWAVKGDAEIYAEKIKKVDPTYVMPEKAGCISFANKKN
ncbi:MAG: hypothetical protein IJY11_02040 [Clostridia bacterium]|nr:hypothetical protein [Clostridia bacterium]